jgi:hypothetical protein
VLRGEGVTPALLPVLPPCCHPTGSSKAQHGSAVWLAAATAATFSGIYLYRGGAEEGSAVVDLCAVLARSVYTEISGSSGTKQRYIPFYLPFAAATPPAAVAAAIVKGRKKAPFAAATPVLGTREAPRGGVQPLPRAWRGADPRATMSRHTRR